VSTHALIDRLSRRLRRAGQDPGPTRGPVKTALMRSVLTVVCTFALLNACAQTAPSQPPVQLTPSIPTGLSGRLLLTRDLGLWTLDLATSGTTQIVRPPEMGQILTGRWSPDGTRVAYALFEVKDRRTPASQVAVVNADGTNLRSVLSTEGAGMFFQQPVWDRDGQHLFVLHIAQTAEERTRRIARLNINSGELTTVTEEIGQFDVSPDGRTLAVIKATTGPASIVLIDVQTGEQRVLVPERQYETITALRFDPTGQTIVFSAAGLGTPAAQNAPGIPREIGSIPQLLGFPQPAAAHGPPQDVFTIPVGGGSATRLLPLQADEPVATYSPDGSRLAVLSIEALSMVQLSNGSRTQIMSPGGAGSLDWAR
jgi:Tol biopolymer transport system component